MSKFYFHNISTISFDETNLDDELNMIDVNVKALHILTKLYLKDMKKRDSGTILNVASSAAFFPGPLLSSYYASKSYVYKLSLAINDIWLSVYPFVINLLILGIISSNG